MLNKISFDYLFNNKIKKSLNNIVYIKETLKFCLIP